MLVEAALSAAAPAAFLAWAVRGRSAQVFAPSIWRLPPGQPPALALTFDDGPSESTPRLLDILDKLEARATFFQCGVNVRRLPRVARQVVERGHEAANHTDTHRRFDFMTPSGIEGEIAAAQRAIFDATGATPSLFRAPYGVRWFGLRSAQARHGLRGVMWTAIGLDWKLDAAAIVRRLEDAGNGWIVCLHDGKKIEPKPDIEETIRAVQRVVPLWKDRGLRIATVTELLCPNP